MLVFGVNNKNVRPSVTLRRFRFPGSPGFRRVLSCRVQALSSSENNAGNPLPAKQARLEGPFRKSQVFSFRQDLSGTPLPETFDVSVFHRICIVIYRPIFTFFHPSPVRIHPAPRAQGIAESLVHRQSIPTACRCTFMPLDRTRQKSRGFFPEGLDVG